MVIIPREYPDLRFDFELEAKSAAVNEACDNVKVAAGCSLEHLCPMCEALAAQILHRLERAFVAGQASMQVKEAVS